MGVYMEHQLLTDAMFYWNAGQAKRPRSCRITESLRQFDNVKFRREALVEHTKDTPLWKLHTESSYNYNESNYPVHHRSDAVRVAILYKSGGIYLDLDCMVMRPLHCLENTVGDNPHAGKQFWLENSVLVFQAGHPFLHYLMRFMVYNYNPEDYISMGPTAVTEAFRRFCDIQDGVVKPSFRHQCRNDTLLMVQPKDAFFAINQVKEVQHKVYQTEADQADVDLLKNSFLLHVFGAEKGRYVPENSLYGLLAQELCPTVYAMAIGEGEF